MLGGKPGAGLSGGQLMMMIITDYPGMETSDTAFPHLHGSPAHNQVHISATRRGGSIWILRRIGANCHILDLQFTLSTYHMIATDENSTTLKFKEHPYNTVY